MIKYKLKPGKILLFLSYFSWFISKKLFIMVDTLCYKPKFFFQANVLYLIIIEFSMEGLGTRWILREAIDVTMDVMQIGTKYYPCSIYSEYDWDSKSLKCWQNNNKLRLRYQPQEYNVSQNQQKSYIHCMKQI